MNQWRQTITSYGVTLSLSVLSIVSLIALSPKENQNNVNAFSFISIPKQDSHYSTASEVARIPRSSRKDAIAPSQFPNKSDLQASNNNWLSASFPVENFKAYTSPFGYRPSATGGSNWEFHSGLDIAAPQGRYIRNGVVVGFSPTYIYIYVFR
ncbi:hypothetical protein NUACC21_11420 [Scytonema sp. NUACC21]